MCADNKALIGEEVGATCGRDGCDGVMEPVDGVCSCHIVAPCGYCEEGRIACNKCGEEFGASMTVSRFSLKKAASSWVPAKSLNDYYNEMDGSKLAWVDFPHTNFSMIKKGKCPSEMSAGDVASQVNGTFGGRFVKWHKVTNREGVEIIAFEFVAYTD